MDNEKFQELVLQKLDSLNDGQLKLNQRVGNLEQGQQGLQQDVKTLQLGQQGLQQDVSTLRQGQKVLTEGQQSLEKGQQRIETRLENEVIDKLRALFDDRSVNQDYFASIRNSQARMEKDLGSLVHWVIDQNDRIKEHDRELRLFRIEKK